MTLNSSRDLTRRKHNATEFRKFSTMKRIALWVAAQLVTLVSLIFIIPDRLIQALDPRRDIPSMHEINEFDHEKDNLARRWALYIVVTGLLLLFQWWFGFVTMIVSGVTWTWNLIF